MPMNILGLSVSTHDSAAALIADGTVKAAIEESKLVRARCAGGLPRAAAQFCLQKAGLTWADLDRVAVTGRPLRGRNWQTLSGCPLLPIAHKTNGSGPIQSVCELSRELDDYQLLKRLAQIYKERLLRLDHHLCHAASAFFASNFDRALILVLDTGDLGGSGLVALG